MMREISIREIATLKERLEVLDGSRRGGPRDRAAVRLGDLGALLTLPQAPKSAKAAGGSVTTAEFDALVDDVHALHRHLLALARAIQARRTL